MAFVERDKEYSVKYRDVKHHQREHYDVSNDEILHHYGWLLSGGLECILLQGRGGSHIQKKSCIFRHKYYLL